PRPCASPRPSPGAPPRPAKLPPPRPPRPPPPRPCAAAAAALNAGPAGLPSPPPPGCACCANGVPGRRMYAMRVLSADHVGLESQSTLGDMYVTLRAATSYTAMKL